MTIVSVLIAEGLALLDWVSHYGLAAISLVFGLFFFFYALVTTQRSFASNRRVE